MKRSMALIAVLLLVACGGGSTTTTDDSPATTAGTPATTAPTATTADSAATTAATGEEGTLQVATSDLGEILTDAEGNTLYLFMPDEQGGEPTCYEECAANWPPFTGTVSAGNGLDASLLATATRTDGGEQVVYNDWPLYYFIGDEAPGDTNGQGLNDIWWVVDAAGEAISS